jgi:hypothetical protein
MSLRSFRVALLVFCVFLAPSWTFAGAITADSQLGGVVLVTGTSRADALSVTQRNGNLVLTAGAGSTVNGRREVRYPMADVVSFQANLMEGADSLTLQSIVDVGLTIDMGDGPDSLALKRIHSGIDANPIQVNMGAGNDNVNMVDVVTTFVTVDLGAGNDNSSFVNIRCVAEGGVGSLGYSGGDGDDWFMLRDCQALRISLSGGAGNDVTQVHDVIMPSLPAEPNEQEGSFQYLAGNNSFDEVAKWDVLIAFDCELTKPVFYGGNGNDTMYVADTTLDGDWTLFMGFDGNDSWESTRCYFPKALPSSTVEGWTGRDRFISTQDIFDQGRPTPTNFEVVRFR